MKIKLGTYAGSSCWQAKACWLYADIDWNTRWPFGTSMGIHFGPGVEAPGFLLDLNAPLGEPNRLYLMSRRWHVTLSLITWWTFRETGRKGRQVHGDWVRCRPHREDSHWLTLARRDLGR